MRKFSVAVAALVAVLAGTPMLVSAPSASAADAVNLAAYSTVHTLAGIQPQDSFCGVWPWDGTCLPFGWTWQKGDQVNAPSGKAAFIFSRGGYFYVTDETGRIRWRSLDNGQTGPGQYGIFQADGNLVIYNSANQPVWNSRTEGNEASLVVQNDGNVVIYLVNPGPGLDPVPLWATGTNH